MLIMDILFQTWDEDLANMAQEWADGCDFEHGGLNPNTSPFK